MKVIPNGPWSGNQEITKAMLDKIVFWDAMEREHLTATNIDDAVTAYIEEMMEYGPPVKLMKLLPVQGYIRMEPHIAYRTVLDRLIEDLDEEHGSMDSDFVAEITEEMIEAERNLIDVVMRDYQGYQCEPAVEVVVDLATYMELIPVDYTWR